MLTDKKLSKAQISKIIQSGRSFGSWLGNLKLVSNLISNAINKFERKISGKGVVRAGKRFTLFTSNEYIIKIIKIINSFKDSGVLIDGVTGTVKHEIKKTRRRISLSFVSTFSLFFTETSNFFCSKGYKWKRS